ncbi:NACHT domain-containing protein [Amycolatopsis sp. NPDC004169]|uniref:NACHT domain-containing protein n=1 Tax=Amycolatopsis sp. NPDC004169 TaxID=3154453 RepID=UPI0033A09D82
MLFPSRRRLFAVLAALVAVVGYVLVRAPLETSNALASVLAGLLALAGGFAALARFLAVRRKAVDTLAEGTALAAELLDRWGPELVARRLRSGADDALPVQWHQVGATAKPRRVVTGNPEQAVLDVAAAFRALPKQRAVLLGEPGGGKTFLAISLVVGLLAERTAGDKVPVLLSLSAWDPVADDLDTFIVRALAAAHYAGAERIPRALLEQNVIFPVLDGLDELPEHLRRRALSRINATLAGHRPILLTCRSVEYAEGVAAGAPALRQSPVFEVLPLTPGQIGRRLQDDVRWAPVADAVRADPAGPLGIALSTPLMLSLFTKAYADRDPSDLLALTSGNDVRDRLVDVLIDSVYPEHGHGWTAGKARRYLTYLARHLHQHAERELNRWRLPNRVLSPWTGALVGLAGGGVVAAVLAPLHIKDPTKILSSPFTSAAVFGLFCTILWFLGLGRRVDQRRLGFRSGARDGALLVLVPAAIALVILLATDSINRAPDRRVAGAVSFVFTMAALAAVCALAVGLHRHLIARAAVVGRAEPADVLRRERRATLLGAAGTLVVAATLTVSLCIAAACLGMQAGQRVAATLGIPVVIRPVLDQMPEPTEKNVTAFAVQTLVITVLLVVAVLLTSRWPRYVVAKVLLGVAGRLPLRLERFLADARDKGLLRAGVAGYEFWHVALQERLVIESKDVRTGRPGVRVAALWLSAVTVVAAVVVVDLAQPAACGSTGLPHADTTLVTVVDADGTAQCAAVLDADDVAKLMGNGSSVTQAEKVLEPDTETSDLISPVAVLGQFSDMAPGTFNAVTEGIDASHVTRTYRLYTTPQNGPIADSAVSLLSSKLTTGYTALFVRFDGSVLVAGNGIPSLTTRDPTRIAQAVIENTIGLPSALAADNVLDGVDAGECTILQAERFAKTIDLRGKYVSERVLSTLTACGKVAIAVDQPIRASSAPVEVRYVTDEPLRKAEECQRTLPFRNEVSVAACTVAKLSDRIYSGLVS